MRRSKSSLRTTGLILSALLLATFGLVPTPKAHADSQQKLLTVSPASTNISLKPGDSQLENISVLNSGNADFTVSIFTSPYRVQGVDYTPTFTQLPGTTDAASWVHLSKTKALIQAHETVVVPYTLTIPTNTAPGGYYAVVFIETQQTVGGGVQTLGRVGDVIYITAQGEVHTGGSILSLPIPHFSMSDQLPMSLEVSNTGGVHFLTTATVNVKNVFGVNVFTDKLQRYVLPQTIRKITSTWKTPQFGLFFVSRSATIANQPQTVPDDWVIIVPPWVLITAGILLALVVLTLVLQRKYKRSVK